MYPTEDGTVQIRGRLAPEVGALLLKALAAARETLYQRRRGEAAETDPPTLEQQHADALALLAETALHHELDPGAPGERYQVVVHVDAAVLADAEAPGQSVLEDGLRGSAETAQRLACDASRVIMRHDAEGRVVEVGARTRTIPPALRRALQYRDGGCRFPGAACGSGRVITSSIGLTADPRRSRTSPRNVADTTARCTKRASRSSEGRTASYGFAVRLANRCRRCPGALGC